MFLIILIISIETLTMRVLITVPTKSGYGGVTNYYLGIKEYWKENIEYFYFGRKPWRNIFYPFLIIRFIIRLICFKPDIVLLNPSLGDKALKRDFIYLNILNLSKNFYNISFILCIIKNIVNARSFSL